MKKFRRYRALIFDYDDTLVNTFKVRSKAIQDCGRIYYNKKISNMLIRTFWGMPFQKFLPEIMETKEPYEQVAANYFKVAADYPLKLFPGVKETLEQLAREYLLGIVSSSNREIMDFDLDKLGLETELFFDIQTSDETRFHKPDERVFKPLLKKLNAIFIHPKEVLFIGDSFYDMRAAQSAGLDFLGVATGMVTYDQFYKSFANVIKQLSDLPGFLAKQADD
jgi:phosphoglycolate phosphatase